VDRIAVKASNVDLWRKVREKINNDKGHRCCPEIKWAENRIYYPDCGNWDYVHDAEGNHCKIISAAEYLNEGGKDVSEFKVGDRVEVNSEAQSNVGRTGVITQNFDNGNRFEILFDKSAHHEDVNAIYYLHKLNKLTKTQTTKENNMNKNISDVFDKTKEALLVEKHLGAQIGQGFIAQLTVQLFNKEILAEAKRLEKEEKDK
jgi:hypothetical protein